MTSKPYVVYGEAPESGSEDEIDSSNIVNSRLYISKGKIVGGEAPESDEESCGDTGSLESVSSALSASSLPSLTGTSSSKRSTSKKAQSLLTKKLFEKNVSLSKNIKEFVSQTASNASSELNATNQQLLKCQVQLQEAEESLKNLNVNLSTLKFNLMYLLSTPYIPDICIDTEEGVSN